MRRLSLTLLGMFVLGCGSKPEPAAKSETPTAPASSDNDRLQGVWSIEAIEDGSNAGKTRLPQGRVQFHGNDMIVTLTKDDSGERMTFSLDESRSPKWITLTSQDAGRPDQKGLDSLVEEGIYRLEGDELTVARSPVLGMGKSPRPTEFQARAWKDAKLGDLKTEPPVIVWRLKKTDEPFFTPRK